MTLTESHHWSLMWAHHMDNVLNSCTVSHVCVDWQSASPLRAWQDQDQWPWLTCQLHDLLNTRRPVVLGTCTWDKSTCWQQKSPFV